MSEGPSSTERLFLFVQCELPWELGPPDGRYLLRDPAGGEPRRVIVLATLKTGRGPRARPPRAPGDLRRRLGRDARRTVAPEPAPTPVTVTRATMIDPEPVAGERQARAWLRELDGEREVASAFGALNQVLYAQRIATADPYLREVSPPQALTVRAGWGAGEQVAEGRWLHAVELGQATGSARIRRRASALRPEERLARMLGARERALLCEEHALRARLDLDQGRPSQAVLELERALTLARRELADEQRGDLPLRLQELNALAEPVQRIAAGAPAGQELTGQELTGRELETVGRELTGQELETVGHALARLEAALRARSAAGPPPGD